MTTQREFQENDVVRVYGARELMHVNGGGMQVRRAFRLASIIRRDEQHGRGQWRVRYLDSSREDVVALARLELIEDDQDLMA